MTNGTLSVDDCRLAQLGLDPTDQSFVDVFRITVVTDGFLTVSMNSSSFDTFLFILDESLTDVIDADDDGGGGTNSLVSSVPISAGTYVILANSFAAGEIGSYTLITSFQSGGAAACDSQVVSPNAVTNGTLSVGDCRLAQLGLDPTDQSFVDVFRITVAMDGFLTVSMNSFSFDTFVFILDESLTGVIVADDDGGGGTNSLVSSVPISAGTYVILANSFAAGETGSYTLTTSFQSRGNPSCDIQTTLLPNSTIEGTITVDDCTLAQLGLNDGSFADQYRVELPQGGQLSIRLESTDFDSFLLVFDETLTNEIAVNDDVTLGDLNSFLDLNLSPGTYVVLANTFDVGETGAYTLTLVPEPVLLLLHLTVLGTLGALARSRDHAD